MRGQMAHLDAEVLAEFRAGLITELILDHDLLSPDTGELVAEKARQQVAAAPGRIGHDEADRP